MVCKALYYIYSEIKAFYQDGRFMSSLFFTFFSPLFGTGFREPFYQFSPAWQDFFLTFFKFFVTLLLRFFTSSSEGDIAALFYRPLLARQAQTPHNSGHWHGIFNHETEIVGRFCETPI
jgi:hypothetical protein